MISDKSVQTILETAKVEEVIEDFINLQRRGVNLLGLCPFHNEKTPSFTVSPGKNIYKCFGCGKAGNPVQFLMDHESMTFPEALRALAAKYNIEIEETETSQAHVEERKERESLYLLNDYALKYYQDELFETDEGKSIGLSYYKGRGFREDTIRNFGLGFAKAQSDAFTLKATQEGYKVDQLQKIGLTSKYGKDFFRDRVMFTLHNLSGKVVGFAGRILKTKAKAPKYINSPETEIYNKSKFLYGIYQAKKAIRQQNECLMVEGYTDVISLHQAGVQNVVASSGTSLTVDQISLVKRFTPNIKILYDGDAAGIKAALRGLDLVLEQDLNVRIVLLPDGEDPDSFMQSQGLEKFETYLKEQAQDFIFFKTNLLLKESNNDPIRKAEVIKDIVKSIARIPDPIKRSLYVKECSQLMKVDERILMDETNNAQVDIIKKQRKYRQNNRRRESSSSNDDPGFPSSAPPLEDGMLRINDEQGGVPDFGAKPALPKIEFQERDLVRVLVTEGDKVMEEEGKTVAVFLFENLEEEVIEHFTNPQYKEIFQLAKSRIDSNQSYSESFWINHSNEKIQRLAIDLTTSPFVYSPNWEDKHQILLRSQARPEHNFSKDAIKALKRYRLRMFVKISEENQERIKECSISKDDVELFRLLKLQRKLQEMRNQLAKELGTVVFGK